MTSDGGFPDSALSGAKGARLLPGHSGALVYLVTFDEHRWFVRKVAARVEESGRLREQSSRQQAFLQHDPPVGTPQVVGEGIVDGRYYFDMEYVAGRDAASYLRTGTYRDVRTLADQLCDYILYACERPPLLSRQPQGGLGAAVSEKLFQVVEQVPEASILSTFDRSAFDRLEFSLCHGDLTLENIIISRDGRVYLLDFLASPLDHTWFDIAKLHQDLEGGWYLRRGGRIAHCATTYLSRQVIEACEKRWNGYRQVHDFLVALAFFRIVPYARTTDDRAFALLRAGHFAARARLESQS